MPDPHAPLALLVPSEFVEAIAERVAELVAERLENGATSTPSPWLTVDQAAEYLGCKRQRLYDLTSQGRLHPGRDGSRLLFRKQDLEHHLAGRGARA